MNIKLNRVGNQESNSMHLNAATGETKQGSQRKTLNAMDLDLMDSTGQKKLAAKKEAMKKLGDVFSYHLKIDNEIHTRTNRMAELDEEAVNAQKELEKVTKSKADLEEAYEGNLDSEKYKKDLKDLEDAEDEWKRRVQSAKSNKDFESSTVNAIHKALLKSDPMVNATKEADEIMEKANDEIVSEVVNQAKDDIDDKLEEEIEDAKKAKAEKEEEEKRYTEKEDRSIKDTTDVIQSAATAHNKIKNEIKNLINTQQLVEEDLKGLEVNQQL